MVLFLWTWSLLLSRVFYKEYARQKQQSSEVILQLLDWSINFTNWDKNLPAAQCIKLSFSTSRQMLRYHFTCLHQQHHSAVFPDTVSNLCTLLTSAFSLNPLFSDKSLLQDECGCWDFSHKSWEFYLIYVADMLTSCYYYYILPFMVNKYESILYLLESQHLDSFFIYSLDTIPAWVLLAPQTAVSRLQDIVDILP